ncbi:MAG: hypothetical protein KAJ97_04935 [Acidobacteria bacterium]|nr:hypothetical protein [Acidobacteriota bacterium]
MRVLQTWIVLLAMAVAAPQLAAEETEPNSKKALRLFYDRGFRLGSAEDKFSLRINGLLQVRYTYVDYDPAVRYNQSDYSNFYVRRARLYFTGHAADPRFTYFIHIQLEPSQGLKANDMWVEYRFSDMLRLGAGRNKIAYGLEFMNSGSALGMVDRSVMYGETDIDVGRVDDPGPRYPGGGTSRFGLNWHAVTGFSVGGLTLYRSLGVQLQGRSGSVSTPTFEYQAGLWQGSGTGSLSNRGNGHLYSMRVGYHPWGWVDWRVVGDVDDTEHFKLGVLASAYVNSDDQGGGFDEGGHNLAAMARYRGWSVDIEWGTERSDYDLFAEDFEREGWRASVGWFVVPARWEVRARYAEIQRLRRPTYQSAVDSGLGIPEVWDGEDWTPALESKISETSVALSYRLPGWRNKLMLDLSRLERQFAADPDAVIDGQPSPVPRHPDQVDWRVRAMVQLVF